MTRRLSQYHTNILYWVVLKPSSVIWNFTTSYRYWSKLMFESCSPVTKVKSDIESENHIEFTFLFLVNHTFTKLICSTSLLIFISYPFSASSFGWIFHCLKWCSKVWLFSLNVLFLIFTSKSPWILITWFTTTSKVSEPTVQYPQK